MIHKLLMRLAVCLTLAGIASPAIAQTDTVARGLAVQARATAQSVTSLREVKGPLRALAIGDSLTYGNSSNGTRSKGMLPYVNQVELRSGGRIVVHRSMGIPGNTSSAIAIRLYDEGLLIPDVDIAFVLEGTNDLAQSVAVATLAKNDRLIIRALRARGIKVVMIAIPPNDANGAGSLTFNASKQATAAAEGAIWIDPWAAARKPDGTFVTGASGDGIHPLETYTAIAAQVILSDPQVASLLPRYGWSAPQINGDLTVPAINGDFSATYISGSNVVPSGWSVGTNTTSAVAVDPVTGFGIVTLTPTLTAATTMLAANNIDVSALSGRRVVISGKISTTGLAASGGAVGIRVSSGSNETVETDFVADPMYRLATDVMGGVFSQELTLPAGLSKMTINVFLSGPPTSVSGLTVALSEVSIRQTTLQGQDTRTRRQPERIRQISADAALTVDDQIVLVNASAGAVTVTLPAAGSSLYGYGSYSASYQQALSSTGLPIQIIRTDASANAVTVQRVSTDTVEGATSFTLAGQYAKATLRAVKTGLWIKQ